MLTPREKLVLGEVIRQYIQSATPVSSSSIAKHSYLGMSPATIRNILAQLEMKGYIYQPHPSAGRIPNTLGYRVYVNDLMKRARLTPQERNAIRETLLHAGTDLEEVMREVSRILAHLARQLGIILSPRIEKGVFERMEIVPISSERVLVVISIQSGLVKTIVLEINSIISREKL
ncbi:MAG: HrcA family transcriptional regulator, partial [Calditrichaeota bacterium]